MWSAREGGRGGEESRLLDLRLMTEGGFLVDEVDDCLDGTDAGSKNGSLTVVMSSFGKLVTASSLSSLTSSSLSGDERPLRVDAVESVRMSGRGPNNWCGGHVERTGDPDFESLLRVKTAVEVFDLGRSRGGGVGSGRGLLYLSSGFKVLTPDPDAPTDALRVRNDVFSVGTERMLTDWPGRYGQAVVDGSDSLCTSIPSSTSY